MKRFVPLLAAGLLAACSEPPKSAIPPLTPNVAGELLRNNRRAQDWLTTVKRMSSPACEYKLDLPDQTTNPTEIDLDHIVVCGATPAPRQFNASVSFVYDPAAQHWIVMRFSS